MRILWFEVTPPSRYYDKKAPIAGWQDALENIVFTCSDIELFVSFETKDDTEIKKIDGVTYIPFNIKYSKLEQKRNEWTYDIYKEKVLKSSLRVIEVVQPDLIHVFGCEWPFGLVAEKVDIPVVIHTITKNARYQFVDEIGFDDYIEKPVTKEKIKPVLKKLFKK